MGFLLQPTAEQLRIAQIVNDANKSDYPDLKDKVEKVRLVFKFVNTNDTVT